jgi:hypothetical protein
MENLPTVYTGLRLPASLYSELVNMAGGRKKGKDGQLSAIIREYITRGIEQDRAANVLKMEESK